MSKYGNCFHCLCEVCNKMRCKNIYKRYSFDFCTSMIMRERCPIIKCDFFRHKEKLKVFRIVRREKKRDKLMERLDEIQTKLDKLTNKL